MPFYVPQPANALASDADWFIDFLARDTGLAYRVAMQTAANIRDMHRIYEGVPRPAFYAPYDADFVGSYATTQAAANTRYWVPYWGGDIGHQAVNSSGRRWIMPAGVPACNKIVVQYIRGLSGPGTAFVYVKRGEAAYVQVGTVNCAGADSYRAEMTLDLGDTPAIGSLQEGDILEISGGDGSGGGSRISCWYGYDSTRVATAGQAYAIPTLAAVTREAGSSFTRAYKVGPDGQATHFVGGTAHQGGADAGGFYGKEVQVTETWTKDGEVWTPTQGWTDGVIGMSRVSVADYNNPADTLLADLTCDYTFGANYIDISHGWTNRVAIARNECYCAMLAALPSFSLATTLTGEEMTLDTPGDDPVAFTGLAGAARAVSMYATPGGAWARLRMLEADPAVSFVGIWQAADNYDKLYVRHVLPTAQDAASSVRWRLDFAGSPLRVPMAALIASGVLGKRR